MNLLITLYRLALPSITASLLWACAAQEIKAPATNAQVTDASIRPDVESKEFQSAQTELNTQSESSESESSGSKSPASVIAADIERPNADKPKFVEVKVEPVKPKPVTPKPKPVKPKPKPVKPKPKTAAPMPAIEPVELKPVELKPVVIPLAKLPPVDFQLEQLPLIIDGQWRLTGHIDYCSLSTLEFVMEDGQGPTTVRVQLNPDNWRLLTQSDIDLSYPDTGLTFDSGEYFGLGQLDGDTNVVFSDERSRIIDAFVKAKKLQIAVGFWPTWPVTEAKTLEIPVDHFERAYRAWKLCQQRINAR